jgi:hypothetical protein
MRRFQRAHSILERTPWQLLGGQFHNLGSFPPTTLQASWKKGRVSVLHPQHGTTLKDGVESISLSVLRLKMTAAAHIGRVRWEEQGTRYLGNLVFAHHEEEDKVYPLTLIEIADAQHKDQ